MGYNEGPASHEGHLSPGQWPPGLPSDLLVCAVAEIGSEGSQGMVSVNRGGAKVSRIRSQRQNHFMSRMNDVIILFII